MSAARGGSPASDRDRQRMRANRSASSSQALTARTTSCRGGMPCGKRARRSASRSTLLLSRLAAGGRPRRPVVRLARALLLELEVPGIPCARFRWAPSAAARPNVRPHSGHLNVPALVAVARVFLFAVVVFLAVAVFGRCLGRAIGSPRCVEGRGVARLSRHSTSYALCNGAFVDRRVVLLPLYFV